MIFPRRLKTKKIPLQTRLILNENFNNNIRKRVLFEGYSLSEPRNENQNNDSILIAYAMANKSRVIVTKEGKGKNQIPYICEKLGIEYMNDFEF